MKTNVPPPELDRIEVLTFDCYGTLIDWETGILGAVRRVLEVHGVEASDRRILEAYAEEEAKQESGDYQKYTLILRSVMTQMSRRFGFEAGVDELDCIARSLPDWQPFPDTGGALRRLRKQYRLGIISNVDDTLFAATAKRLQVDFDWVITAEQVRAYKPASAVFEHAFARIGLPRDRLLHIAQSIYHDIVPARSLGLATAWVNRRAGKAGFGATRPASAQADFEVTSLSQLADFLGVAA